MNSLASMSMKNLLRSHRSVRRFTDQPIERELIDEILEEAHGGASNSSNLSQIAVIRTCEPARKAHLFELHFRQSMVLQAPLLLTFCADVHRTRQWLDQRQVRNNFDNLLGFQSAAIDATILAQTTALLLESHGLGICYMGSTMHWAKEIAEFLELPAHCMPIVTLAVGWPAEQPLQRQRLPGKAWIYDERYTPHSTESIDALYGPHETREWEGFTGVSAAIRSKLAAVGIDSMAKYITSDLGYSPAVFARDSKRFLQLLVAKGFLSAEMMESAVRQTDAEAAVSDTVAN